MIKQESHTTLSGRSISNLLTYISTGTCPVTPGLLQQLVIWPTWGFGQQALESAKRLRQDNPAPRQVWIPDSHVNPATAATMFGWMINTGCWLTVVYSRLWLTSGCIKYGIRTTTLLPNPWCHQHLCIATHMYPKHFLFKRPHNSRQPRAACTLCQQTPSRPPYGLDQEWGADDVFLRCPVPREQPVTSSAPEQKCWTS